MTETLHIYTRVSTSAQETEGTSLESQQELGKNLSKQLGLNFKVWNEGGQSSAKDDLDNRPVLVNLLSEVDAGEVNHLYVFNTDRLSRNQKTWGMIRYKLNQNKVLLYTGSDPSPIDLQNPTDDLLVGLLSEISQYDNKLRRERFRLGKLNRVKQGGWLGGPPPYGYQIVDKKLVPHPTEKKWVNYIFESYKNRKSVREIRQHLMLNGVVTRRGNVVWSMGSIEKLLTNTHYSGYYKMTDKKTGEVIRVDCESLVPLSLYSETIKERERRSKVRVGESNIKRFYLLREFLTCKHCGSYFSAKTQSDSMRSVYYCPRKERNFVDKHTTRFKECGNSRYLKINQTDELVWNVVTDVLKNSSQFKDEVKRQIFSEQPLHSQQRGEVSKLKKTLKKYESDLSGLKATIVTLHTDKLLKKTDQTDIEQVIKNIENYRIELDGKIEDIKNRIVQYETQKNWVDWVSEFGKRIENFSEFSPEDRKKLLINVVEKIEVETVDKQSHKLTIHFKLPYVDDKIEWVDKIKKSLGYQIKDGKKVKEVEISTSKKE